MISDDISCDILMTSVTHSSSLYMAQTKHREKKSSCVCLKSDGWLAVMNTNRKNEIQRITKRRNPFLKMMVLSSCIHNVQSTTVPI